jgi:dTDP-4-dehydrorhamnose 3,5-epimerase
MKLDPKIERALTFQRYNPEREIHGVWHHSLTKHRALEGAFMEFLRLSEGHADALPVPFQIRQVSMSWAEPGRVNAFHLHPKRIQDELWCVVTGTALVWLVDLRLESPTCNGRQRQILSGEAPGLLHIPSGVAHGYRAGTYGAILLYAASTQFDEVDPNEGRLPWDYFGADLWQEDRG